VGAGAAHAMKIQRVVLDTNVLLSTLVFTGGQLQTLRLHWQSKKFIPVACKETVEELIRVLGYSKFNMSEQRRDDLLADYLPYIEIVELPPQRSHPHLPICRDQKDQVFLELAFFGQADTLVSGDKDLLDLDASLLTHTRFRVLSPQAFLAASAL
jgi:uncharacterized protein